jgi:uncharacterized protein YdaU (DUF1376 family)
VAELPFMLVRVAAILADTTWMSAGAIGVYQRLLYAMRLNGCRLRDERELCRIAGVSLKRWWQVRPTISHLFISADGELSQKRLTETFLTPSLPSISPRSGLEKKRTRAPDEGKIRIIATGSDVDALKTRSVNITNLQMLSKPP